MIKILLFILTFLFFQTITAQIDTLEKYDFLKKYSIHKQEEDLIVLKATLEKSHPGLYWHTTKQAFESEYKKLFDNIKIERTEHQFSQYILPVLAQIHCSHTSMTLSDNGQKCKSETLMHFPIAVKIINNKLYIKEDFSDDSTFSIGTEILSINRIKTQDLLFKLVKCCWVDGNNLQAEFSSLEAQFLKLMDYTFDYPDTYSFETLTSKGELIKRNRKAISLSKINSKLYKKEPNQLFSTIDSLKIGVLTFNNFIDTTFEAFLDQTFQTIEEKNVEHLVIDLRKNGGGFDHYGMYLYSYIALSNFNYYNRLEMVVDNPSDTIFKNGYFDNEELLRSRLNNKELKRMTDEHYYLAKDQHYCTDIAPFPPNKKAFKGKVYILISNRSFSGASEFCAISHFLKRAKFIGQETGGGYCGNSSGNSYNLILPNTKIRIGIPLIRYLSAIDNCQNKGGIKPDFEITQTINDLITNTDHEMKFTLDLIKKRQ